jgi:hypothetical protein
MLDMDAPTSMLICALIALLAAIVVPSLVKFATAFKRSQQWHKENAQDRAKRREYDRYSARTD